MTFLRSSIIVLFTCAFLCAGIAHAETYDEILALAKAGKGEKALLHAAERNEEGFHLTYERIQACKDAGVPESVLAVMMDNPKPTTHSQGVLDTVVFQGWGLRVTLWKLIAYVGTLIFAGRWLVQMMASRKAGRPVTTAWFWVMSFVGSVFCLTYWIFGPKQDSVGVLQNLFPTFVAGYNLYLEIRYFKKNGVPAHMHGESSAVRKAVVEEEAPAESVEVAAGQ